MSLKQLPIYDIDIDLESDELGMQLISIVDNPAIESRAIFLSANIQLAANAEKQYITGPVMIPDKLIYRSDETHGEYNIRFSKDIIERMRNKFFKHGETKLSNIDHQADQAIESILIESWIVEEPSIDKSFTLGLKDIVPGTLMATYHIPDKGTWETVKSKGGFSLEGVFNQVAAKLIQQDKQLQEPTIEQMLDAIAFTLEKYATL